MRFERMIRLTMLAGAALALPGAAARAASIAAAPGQSVQQSADDYQWIDQADALWDTIGDAPPDTAFAFEGQEPWAWQTQDGYTIIVEDVGAGGIRSYYFAPGDTSPFLAVEPGMSFAFDGGRLAMVYDADGEAAPRSQFGDYDDPAHDLFDRGRQLFQALSGRDYRPVDADAWIDASPYIFGFIQLWDEGRTRYPGWSRYHARSDASAWRRRFEDEQRRRREQALRFSHWRQGGFQGPPPGRFHRPGTPGTPGRPGTGRPPQPGSGWSHQPGRPGGPGSNPPSRPGRPPVATPGNPTPPPFTRPAPSRPDGTPDWRRGRPVTPPPAPVIKQPVADVPAPPAETRPPRPRGDGNGWGNGGRPRPTPAPTPPASGAAPVPPASTEAPPAPRPRPDGGWRPRPAPGGDGASPPQFRPRPTQPNPVPRPSYAPPAPSQAPQAAPSRPSYTPPPQRAAPPPRANPPSRPTPPKISRESTTVD